MPTEEVSWSDCSLDTDLVSMAFQAAVPPDWLFLDHRDREVPLSSAGYILHFGRQYHICVASLTQDELLPNLRLVRPPMFVEERSPQTEFRKHGQLYRRLSFRVKAGAGWLWILKGPFEILWDDLEVECYTQNREDTGRPKLSLSIVARTPWSVSLVLLLVVWAFLGWVFGQVQKIITDLVTEGFFPLQQDWWSILQNNPRYWLWPLGAAVLGPVSAFFNTARRLWQRTQELEVRYQQRLSFEDEVDTKNNARG